MRGRLTTQPSRKLGVGKRGERLGDLGRLDLVVVDDQPLEQRLVPLAAQMARCGDVGTLAIGEQVECLAERVLDIAESRFGRFEVALGLGSLTREPVLLGAQQIDRDRPSVVGVQQLLALLVQLGEPLALAGGLAFGLLAHPGHRIAELLADPRSLLARQAHLAVDALDCRLDQIDGDVGLLAAGAPHPADTEEVGVLAPLPFAWIRPMRDPQRPQ